MNINLSTFLSPIDGEEIIRITNYNNKRTMFEGKKFMCPFLMLMLLEYGQATEELLLKLHDR